MESQQHYSGVAAGEEPIRPAKAQRKSKLKTVGMKESRRDWGLKSGGIN